MSAESELLIKIRTILESQGIDAAKKSLDEISKTNQSATLTQGQSTIEMQKATRAAFALRMAANGSTEGFRGLAHAALGMGESLGMLVGRITMVGAAFAAGWKIGTIIREQFTDPIDKAKSKLSELYKENEKSKTLLEGLNKTDADAMVKRIQDMADQYTRAVNQAERLARLQRAKDDVQLSQDLANNQLLFESGGISEIERNRRDLQSNKDSEQRKLQIEEDDLKAKKMQAQKEVDDARHFLATADQQKGAAGVEKKYLQEEAAKAGWTGGDKVNSGNIVDVIVQAQNQLREAQDRRKLAGADKPIGEFRNVEMIAEADKAIKEAKAILQFAPGIAAAARKEQVADETLKSDSAKSKKALITDKTSEISDIDAHIGILPEKRHSVSTKYEAQEFAIDNQVKAQQKQWHEEMNKQGSRDATIAYESEKGLRESIRALPSTLTDNTGQPASPQSRKQDEHNRETLAYNAIQSAKDAANAGEDVDKVTADLVRALTNIGVKLSGKIDSLNALKEYVDGLDGVIGGIRSDIANLKSQSAAAPGFD